MIQGMFNYGAMPSLERMIRFTGQRQQVLAHNVANLSTPYFKPKDLSVERFQSELGDAIDQRRQSSEPLRGPLGAHGVSNAKASGTAGGELDVSLDPNNRNILFHDRNNRDLERLMQDVAENTLTHRVGVNLLKSEFDLLETAIRERV